MFVSGGLMIWNRVGRSEMTIKKLGSVYKIRVGRATGNERIFFWGGGGPKITGADPEPKLPGGGTSDQWSRRLQWGAKRRKGEGGGGGHPLPQVGVRGAPPEIFWEIASKWCILSAFWGNQYTFLH